MSVPSSSCLFEQVRNRIHIFVAVLPGTIRGKPSDLVGWKCCY
jgi:hypothetical protein